MTSIQTQIEIDAGEMLSLDMTENSISLNDEDGNNLHLTWDQFENLKRVADLFSNMSKELAA